MWPLPRLLKPRDDNNTFPGIPEVCFDVCNNAVLEAQSRGRNATLCDDGSTFNNYFKACSSCVDLFSTTSSDRNALDSAFAPYIEFCDATDGTTPTIDMSWLTIYTTFMPTTLEAPNGLAGESYVQTLYKTAMTFSTRPEYFFHMSVGSIVSTYIPPSIFSQLAHSVSLSAEAASVTGDATSLIYAALEATSVPSWFSAAVPSTYSSQMHTLQEQINQLRATPISLAPVTSLSPTSSNSSSPVSPSGNTPSTDSRTQASKVWIAGPVVGGVAAICLFTLGVFLYQRRRRGREAPRPELEGDTFQETGDKPQLHSDHLPPRYLYEMDASQARSEADDGALPEMAANEAPARELAADHNHLRPSDGGKDVADPVASAEERENNHNAQNAIEARP